MDFSRLLGQIDQATIEHSVLPLIQCLNQRLPGSNIVPYVLGFVIPTESPEENRKTIVFINTTTWTVNTVETPSDYMEAVMTSLPSVSPPSPVSNGSGGVDGDGDGGDDNEDDDDDDEDNDEDEDDDEDEDEKLGPATKESIETIPVVKVVEPGRECSVCLGEFDVGAKAKEMPCKHVYHSACIDKWLGICGSCPLCRYNLPMILKEDDDDDDDDDDEEDEDDGDADVEEEETTEGVVGDDEH